jgi:hypothetical protein
MHSTLRRLALSSPLVAGALLVSCLAASLPAGAKAPHLGAPAAEAPHAAAPGAPRPHTVAPLSTGYIEDVAEDGSTTYTKVKVTPVANVNGLTDTLTLSLATATSTFYFQVRTDNASPLTVGDGGSNLQLARDPLLGGQTCLGGGASETAFQVDQVTWQQVGQAQTPTSAAVQFSCQVANAPNSVAPGGDIIYGALPYNIVPTTPGQGYYEYESDGLLTGFGNDNYLTYLGDLSAFTLNEPVVAMATTPDDAGYWMVASDGGIFNYGDAAYYGSMGGKPLNKPIVGIASTPDGKGYWEVASDGGIFSFGDARFKGSMGGKPLNKPIVGIAAAPGGGYWEVASDGGIFSFGGAPFYGSTGSIHLNKPVVAMTPTADGRGYWFVASDGGIFNYGDAHFYGSTGNLTLVQPIVGMAAGPEGSGYWLAAADGGIFSFRVPFAGSLGGLDVDDVVGIVT